MAPASSYSSITKECLWLTSVNVAVALGLKDKPAPGKGICVAISRPRLAVSSSLIGAHVYIAVRSSCHSEDSCSFELHTLARVSSLLHVQRHMSLLQFGHFTVLLVSVPVAGRALWCKYTIRWLLKCLQTL